jgi:hypothetical protein
MISDGSAHPLENTGKTAKSARSAAKSGAADARLATILDAWPWLPPDVQGAILALVRQTLDSKTGSKSLNAPDAT